MGVTGSKQENQLAQIDRQVNSMRSSMRSSKGKLSKEDQEQYVKVLVNYASQAEYLKGRVKSKRLNSLQRNISQGVEDAYSATQQEADLDMGAVETSSFVQVPLSKREMSNKDLSESPTKRQKNSQGNVSKVFTTTLVDIEKKWKSLKPQIKASIEQRSITDLRVHQETIKVLVRDLEMIEVREHTPISDRKKKLDDNIIAHYREIESVMKDIRREKDLKYLSKQNKRALSKLEDIKKELTEVESILLTSLDTKDISVINGLKENISDIRQRLSSVGTVDESTKQFQRRLMEKLMNISKTIDDNTKTSSQSDLSKAQANYEDLVRNIASGNSIDKDEIKVKLQSLQNFIDGIKEDDETILRRKQQLLNNVRQSFSFILEEEKKVLNTAADSSYKQNNDAFKMLEIIHNDWKSLENILNTSPLEDFTKIDQTLSDIQKSIEETRSKIMETKSLPSSLNNKKLNYSAPNLNKLPNNKFGSSQSVDLTDQPLIRAKAKVYNLSTPHLQNISDQPVVLRNKQFYKNSINPDDTRPFSKIEDIKRQVNYIKEKFDESHQKQHLKNKLESYLEIINNFVHHQNQGVANSAKALLSDIQDLLKKLSNISEAMNVTSKRRGSLEFRFENIVAIQGAVELMENAVNSFNGKKDDQEYIRIVSGLSECQKYLESTEIPPKYDMIQQQKGEIFNKIEVIFNILQSKCFDHYVDADVEETKKTLDNLKERVGRFSGPYKGITYNKIETELKKLLINVPETVSNKAIAENITKEAEKHLNILEHKSTKDQSFRRTLSETNTRNENDEKLMKLKSDLQDIKTAINTAPPNDTSNHIGLKSRLDLVKLGLDQLKFSSEEEEKQRDLLYNEIESLKSVVDTKISLAKQAIKQLSIEQDKEKKDLEELVKIEEKFESLKPQIECFVGTTSHNKFYELDEYSIRLTLKLDTLEFKRGSEAYNKKLQVLKEIYSYGDLLDQRAKESEELLEIERSIEDMDKNFERSLKLNDLENLQQKVTSLNSTLDNSHFNQHLSQRKQACSKRIVDLLRKIAEHKVNRTEEFVGAVDPKAYIENFISNSELQFDNMKKKIDNFYGTMSDVKFTELNSCLTKLILSLNNFKIPSNSELYSRRKYLLKDIRSYTDILKGKAYENEAIKDIHKHLNNINKSIDNYKGKDEELNQMESELRSVQNKIEVTRTRESDKKSLDQKLDILLEAFSRLKRTKEAPKESPHTEMQNDFGKKTLLGPTNMRLAEIQNEILLVRQKVTSFIKSDTSEEYKIIEDTLLRLKLRLGKLDTERNSELIRKQADLEKAIQECFNILDERSADAALIIEAENELNMINKQFTEGITEEQKSALDEKLISLQLKLGRLSVNKDLNRRKSICLDRVVNYMKLLQK